ncbi:MAG TPA: putative ABC exporter domain-containing protein [Archangium sp.]|uniref:putative ABC exporter domain-containing protein n=1 Tax=Archangium sp. TaxID=1872627 RepID=UPI002EDAA291
MSFPRAMAFLWVASTYNRLRRQLQRLRQPKYLVGAIVGGMYVYSLFLRGVISRGQEGMPPPMAQIFSQFMLTAAMLGTLLSAWALGPDRPALSFTETEVQQLFPAPVSRRGLLHYKLTRGLVGAGVGAFFATLFMSRVVSPNPVLFFLGATVTLATVNLHVMGASFVRTRLARRGGVGVVLRWGTLAAVLALFVGAALSVLREHPFPPEELANPRSIQRWLVALMDAPALWPGRALVALPLARDVGAFVRALPLGLGLLAVHYAWVMSAAVPFEEAALVRAEERARLREQMGRQGGRPTPIRLRAAFFRLAPTGRPEVALVWKNLIAGRRLGGAGRLLVAGLLGGLVAAVASGRGADVLANVRLIMAPLCAGLAVILCFFGPSAVRMDLRMDLPRLEQLRAMPLTGRQVVAAELAAPALLLGVTQVGLVVLAVVLSTVLGEPRGGAAWWVAGGLCAVWVLPAVSLGGLFVQNAAVVLFPAWLPPEGERVRGFEALGQRVLTLMGTLVALMVGLLPAGVLAALVGFGLNHFLGFGVWALPFAGFAAAAVLVAEVALGVVGLGRAFDRLDVSSEGPETSV